VPATIHNPPTWVASADVQPATPVATPAAAASAVTAPAPVTDVLDLSVAIVVGVFFGSVARLHLSTDLSVAAGALATGISLQCQRSAGALEMREFISFVASVTLRQGRLYGAFVIFLIFLIKGIAGTPTSSSGTSSLFDVVLDAGKPRHRRRLCRRRRLRPSGPQHNFERAPTPLRRLKGARGRASRLMPPGSLPPWDTTPPLDENIHLAMACTHLELINTPRADLLSFEQARQLHLELSAGHVPTPGIPPSITSTLAIVDTGCATSMAPSDDFFEKGSLYAADVNIIGAGGGLKLNERGTLRYPMESDRHGVFKYGEKDSIKNKNCPYVLIAIGRASFQMGASLYMPSGGGDGTIAFHGGVTITVHNRKVLALRPLGFKLTPRASPALALTLDQIGIPAHGDFIYFIGSGPRHENDVAAHASELGLEAFIVYLDITVGGEAHNFMRRPTIACMIAGGKLDRCRGALISIRCKSWSAAVLMPKPDGSPGTPLRDFPDAILGIQRADGTLPRSVMDGNMETEHITEVAHAIVKHSGFLLVETPTRRRDGTTLFAHHVLKGCERHAHMLDHPAWVRLTALTGAKEVGWDQCPLADVVEGSAIKSSIWWATPDIYPIVHQLFGQMQCCHPKGTHVKLKGVDSSGRYLTAATENYSTGTNRLIARCVHWRLHWWE